MDQFLDMEAETGQEVRRGELDWGRTFPESDIYYIGSSFLKYECIKLSSNQYDDITDLWCQTSVTSQMM